MVPPVPPLLAAATDASQFDVWLRHLDSLYALAQVLTLDPDAAAELVTATFRRLRSETDAPERMPEGRMALLGLVLKEYEAQKQAARDDGIGSGDDTTGRHERELFLRGLTEHIIDRSIPAAFAALPADQRAILQLCDVENVSPADAAVLLNLPVDSAVAYLDRARASLRHSLRANVSTLEHYLLGLHPDKSWLRSGLRRMVHAEFEPPPPTLEPSVRAALRHGPEEPDERPAAGEAPRSPASRGNRPRPTIRRSVVTVLLIFVAGLFGLLISNWLTTEPDIDLITLSARSADQQRPEHETGDAEEAEAFILERLDWRLTVPTISGSPLQGAGISEIAPGVRVPVLFFEGETPDTPLVLYVYTYALLDRYDDRIQLGADIMSQIANDDHFDLHVLGEEQVLIWRYTDDIYIAVTHGDAGSLQSRITYAS